VQELGGHPLETHDMLLLVAITVVAAVAVVLVTVIHKGEVSENSVNR
jgi:hypothetical protein